MVSTLTTRSALGKKPIIFRAHTFDDDSFERRSHEEIVAKSTFLAHSKECGQLQPQRDAQVAERLAPWRCRQHLDGVFSGVPMKKSFGETHTHVFNVGN